jgi:hypothetical protein
MGKLAEAERQIQTLHLKQLTSIFYLTSAQLRPFENEVSPPHNAIRAKLNEQRRQTYREKAKAKIDSYREAILTLESESMRVSAELQEFQGTGGKVMRLTLESAVARMATIPDAAHVLVPLNSMPVIDSDGPAVEKAFWRVDLQPQWVAHRLFFAKAQ